MSNSQEFESLEITVLKAKIKSKVLCKLYKEIFFQLNIKNS